LGEYAVVKAAVRRSGVMAPPFQDGATMVRRWSSCGCR
jgi:hypothetical protein